MKSVQLRQERKKLIEDNRTLLNKADAEKREFTAEENQEYEKRDADIDALDSKIERIEKQEEREKSLGDFVSDKRVSNPADEPETPEKESKEIQKRAFSKFLLHGKDSLSREEVRALNVTTGSQGGYLQAPEVFVQELLKDVDNRVFIRQRASKFTLTSGQSLGVPTLVGRASAATRGGEAQTPTENTGISFGKRELKPLELFSLIKVSEKLMRASALPIDQIVRNEIAYSFAITEEQEFFTGSGAGQALGLFTASSDGISTGRDVSTGNTTTAVTFDNLIDVQEHVKEQYQSACEWFGSRALAKMVRKLKDNYGQFIWEESGKAGAPSMLLGKPYTRSEYVPSTFSASQYVGIYGDFSNYWIADSLNLQIKELGELYAASFQIGFRVLAEMDGAPAREEAFARIQLAAS